MTTMPEPRYPNILRAVYSRPWAILPGTLALIVDILQFRAAGGRLSDEEIEGRVRAASTQNGPRAQSRGSRAKGGAVAVIPVYGPISQRQNIMSANSGGTSIEGLTQDFRDAMADEDVSGIVFDFDSPGGTIDGVGELAAEIRAARGGDKPIVAQANGMAASAAMWLAAQADELVVTPSGLVGSIGVFTAHEDLSAQAEQDGVKTTLISAGKYKTEGNPWEPLTDEARGHLQELVDSHYGMMIEDIAAGRGVTPAAVRNGYGQGRIVLAKPAKAEGMVDRIDTIDNTIARVARGQIPVRGISAGKAAAAGPRLGYANAITEPLEGIELLEGETGTITQGGAEDPGEGSTFGNRLAAVLAEAEDVADHVQRRAAMRAKGGHDLSPTERARARALAGALVAVAGDDVPDPEPDAAPVTDWAGKARANRLALARAEHRIN
jgi:signal peptide peptidase SppA